MTFEEVVLVGTFQSKTGNAPEPIKIEENRNTGKANGEAKKKQRREIWFA